jgi:hypothetical protein
MKTRITIESTNARETEEHIPSWSGLVNFSSEDLGTILEETFRRFNRVSQEDVDYLDAIGYELPSLSVGDMVTVRTAREGLLTYIVCPAGYALLKRDEWNLINNSGAPFSVAQHFARQATPIDAYSLA